MLKLLIHFIAAMAICPNFGSAVSAQPADEPGDQSFRQVSRPGAVDLDAEYSLENLQVPRDQIHTLLPRDAIPALTNPELESIEAASAWLTDKSRIIVAKHGDETVGVPVQIVDWHEIVNLTIGGNPIAVTYCPLCDSATVFSRMVKVTSEDGQTESRTLEFGVSGALFNSNVLMYDRQEKGLWSQLAMKAVSGPLAGTSLNMLPIEVVSFSSFKEAYPEAQVVGRETGHSRDYSRSPYDSYFADERIMVPVAEMGEALPRKTLGLGVAFEGQAWFIPADAIGDEFTLLTSAGAVKAEHSDAGVVVLDKPETVSTAQSFYYSWSAFFPNTQIVRVSDHDLADRPGLKVGDQAPDARVTSTNGLTVNLASVYGDKPVVLIFYRGGWCPFCVRSLNAWREKIDDLKAAGAKLVAVTTENPELTNNVINEHELEFKVYSDSLLEASRAYQLLFALDDATREKYRGFGLDLAASNAAGTWQLPVPATYVIDRDGVIRYVFADRDYKVRAEPDVVIDFVRSLGSDPDR